MKKTLFIISLVISLLLLLSCDNNPTNPGGGGGGKYRTLKIINNISSTDNVITEVRFRSPSNLTTQESWGASISGSTIRPDEHRTLTVPEEFIANNAVDVRAMTQGGRELVKQNVYLHSGAEIEFIDDEIVIWNNLQVGGNTINAVHVWMYDGTNTTNPNEGPNLISASIAADEEQKVVLRVPLYKDVLYSMCIYTTSNDRIERPNQFLVHGSRVEMRTSTIYIRNGISNATGLEISEVYIRKFVEGNTSENWGRNNIHNSIAYSAEGDGFRLPLYETLVSNQSYEVQCVTNSGYVHKKSNIILYDDIKLIFTSADSSTPRANVSITINTDNHCSIEGANIKLLNLGTLVEFNQAATAGSDIVLIQGVYYGIYTLTITHPSYASYTQSVFNVDTSVITHSTTLIALVGSVTINLTASNGASVNGAVVKIVNNDNATITQTKTASTNLVSFTDVYFGAYTLTITHPNHPIFTLNPLNVDSVTFSYIANLTKEYSVGDTGPGSGIVFYDKGSYSNGWRYMEAAPASTEFTATWGCYTVVSYNYTSYYTVGGTQNNMGAGKNNTALIVAKSAEIGELNRAAQGCALMDIGGCDDWYLPSRGELLEMYAKRSVIGGFATDRYSYYYWSSSEYSQYLATSVGFYDGRIYDEYKTYTGRVRACRQF
jgi:hypothetical protein